MGPPLAGNSNLPFYCISNVCEGEWKLRSKILAYDKTDPLTNGFVHFWIAMSVIMEHEVLDLTHSEGINNRN